MGHAKFKYIPNQKQITHDPLPYFMIHTYTYQHARPFVISCVIPVRKGPESAWGDMLPLDCKFVAG